MSKPRFTTVIPATGQDGNVFAVIRTATKLMRKLDLPQSEIDAFRRRALDSESYAAVLAIVREYFPVNTGDEDEE